MAKAERGPFDLEERTAQFGERLIRLLRLMPEDLVSTVLIQQATRSGTSIGANYCEANDSGSKKEFRHRISLCKRESRETKHWLRMLAAAFDSRPDLKDEIRGLWREAKELNLIFGKIYRKGAEPQTGSGH